MGLAADIGVDCERHDFRPLLAFLVETIELVDCALQQIAAFMVLHDHHRDVVEL